MIRINAVSDYEKYELNDKNNIKRSLKLYEKNGILYLGPVQALFNRTFICKDKYRIDFFSKLDNHYNELMNVTVVFDKINEYPMYSNFTIDSLKEFIYSKGYTDDNFRLRYKTYTCAKENFIEFGFNSMNFCLDRRGDIWVHYKEYEEQKQYREIIKNIANDKIEDFDKSYRQMVRFIRYASVDSNKDIKCFTLKSINITKLYGWLNDNHVIHKVNYVSDIYNETLRELSFTDITVENTFIKVIATENGFVLKDDLITA